MKKIQLFHKVLSILFIFGTSYLIYKLCQSRVNDPSEFVDLLVISTKPKVDKRCKIVNSTSITSFICLPNVFFIGASKSGTTTLVDILKQIPNIKFVNRHIHPQDHHSEIHRYDRSSYENSLKFIELAYEWASSPIIPNRNTSVIHYTPHYLYAPSVPFELRDHHPDSSILKFIVILRDPIERAWSSYWFHNSHLLVPNDQGSIDDFYQSLRMEMSQRIRYEKCLHTSNPILFQNIYNLHSDKMKEEKRWEYFKVLEVCFGPMFRKSSLGLRHLDKSIYFDQLHRWFVNFEKKKFHVMIHSDFKTNPRLEITKILKFLLDDKILLQQSIQHLNHMSLNFSRLSQPNHLSRNLSIPINIRQEISTYFEPYNDKLKKLIDIYQF